jgi:hypothetical protein
LEKVELKAERSKLMDRKRRGLSRADVLVGLGLLALSAWLFAACIVDLRGGAEWKGIALAQRPPHEPSRAVDPFHWEPAHFGLKTMPVAFGGDVYAAIAFSTRTGRYGYGFNFATRAGAESRALDDCDADDCRVIVWTRNGCCALAVGEDNKYGYGYGATRGTSESTALEECRKRTSGCRIKCWTCTD